jgi:ketosteroid isomerase-like protein
MGRRTLPCPSESRLAMPPKAAIAFLFVLAAVPGALLYSRAARGEQPPVAANDPGQPLSANKRTVQKYMDAFGKSDHAAVLSCLTEDVEWVIPGMFQITGKAAFDKEIENDAFVGRPTIAVTRLTEENGVVIAEGSVRSTKKDGGVLNVVFCDVFVMHDTKIKHLTSYLMEVKK